MKIIDTKVEDPRPALRARGVRYDQEVVDVVAAIIADVRKRGDAALLENARRFDSPSLETLLATQEEIDEAMPIAEHAFAIDHAIERVKEFHEMQLSALTSGWKESDFQSAEVRRKSGQPRHHVANKRWTWKKPNEPGIGQRLSPLTSAGIYVPGGNANYPSSVIMNVVPAQVAGVNVVTVATPARTDGSLSPAVLYAARYCGVAKVVKVGGAAAIAAMAIGTESVERSDKIAGPGNRYVNEAKRQLWGSVGIDGFAGPSEVCVMADETANAVFVAADYLTQIEHAADNVGLLICTSEAKLQEIQAEIERQLTGSARESTMRAAIADFGAGFLVRDLEEACELANLMAPEHLSLAVSNPDRIVGQIVNAGCVLIGEWTPESAGDYCAGPSHTLPTSTAARFGSPVNVLDFLKIQSLIQLDRTGVQGLIPTIEAFGQMEGFPAHGNGASKRKTEGGP